jgi:hypothetical protein
LLACGIVNTGVRNECDPALALLTDYVTHSSNIMRIGAISGLVWPLTNMSYSSWLGSGVDVKKCIPNTLVDFIPSMLEDFKDVIVIKLTLT